MKHTVIRNGRADWRIWEMGASGSRLNCVGMHTTARAARKDCALMNLTLEEVSSLRYREANRRRQS